MFSVSFFAIALKFTKGILNKMVSAIAYTVEYTGGWRLEK